MRLDHLIKGLDARVIRGEPHAEIRGVWDDSRHISPAPGNLFIARPGATGDGARYIDDALARGAAAVVACDATTTARIAERFHGEPSKKLHLIGVTGTNGKTTTVWMIRHLLNALGEKCGLISTIEIDVGDAKPQAAKLTTPGSCELSATLARMVANGCTHCAMECSSHALDQGRCDALAFDVAVFTNLTGDHLDYHETMDAYAASKARLFAMAGRGVVNGEDAHAPKMVEACGGQAITFSARKDVKRLHSDATGMTFELGPTPFRGPLVGRHNLSNLLGALHAIGDREGLVEAVATLPPVPGRLERVTADDAPFSVLVDYAHTDDALRNVLLALRPLLSEGGSLRVLFGCGGDRDRTKRPRMAEAACDLADHVVITSDNPRREPPQAIIDEVMAGVPSPRRDRVRSIVDRRAAIARIIDDAQLNDIVLLAGKGHEDYQIIGSERLSFDDRVEARCALEARGVATR